MFQTNDFSEGHITFCQEKHTYWPSKPMRPHMRVRVITLRAEKTFQIFIADEQVLESVEQNNIT